MGSLGEDEARGRRATRGTWERRVFEPGAREISPRKKTDTTGNETAFPDTPGKKGRQRMGERVRGIGD